MQAVTLCSAAQQLKALASGAAPELLGMARSIPQHCGVLSILHYRLWDCGTAEPAVAAMPTSELLLVNSSGFSGRFHHPLLVTRVIPAVFLPSQDPHHPEESSAGGSQPTKSLLSVSATSVMITKAEPMCSLLISHCCGPWETRRETAFTRDLHGSA